ncbi:MAG: DUF433 domain-containing protein [Spirosoma sp.]|nr:DUF433 domain-containing protein [Spirosoma sp.]
MKRFTRITLNPEIMGGKPCIRGMRITVGTLVGLVSAGYTTEQICQTYPYIESDDIREALAFVTRAVFQPRNQKHNGTTGF